MWMNVERKLQGRWRKRTCTSTKWKIAKEEHTEEEVRPWNGDAYEEASNTGYLNGVKTVGQGSFLGPENTICNEYKV